MTFRYQCRQTEELKQLILEIEATKKAAELLPKPAELIVSHKRSASLLKSSLYSARIEGNPLTEKELESLNSQTRSQQEVLNLEAAHQWLFEKVTPIAVDLPLIRTLHKLCIKDLGPSPGQLRVEPSAVFNSAGVAVYLAPSPDQIRPRLQEIFDFIESNSEQPLIIMALTHFAFEKVHPFLDGNGRVGRLLLTLLLRNYGYDVFGLLDLNQYIEAQRSTYYDLLSHNTKDITAFVIYILAGIKQQAELAITELHQAPEPQQLKTEDMLLPRRREILEIIKDHKLVSFDFLKRRFISIATSTLHYDLKKLQEEKLIVKRGATRAAMYSLAE